MVSAVIDVAVVFYLLFLTSTRPAWCGTVWSQPLGHEKSAITTSPASSFLSSNSHEPPALSSDPLAFVCIRVDDEFKRLYQQYLHLLHVRGPFLVLHYLKMVIDFQTRTDEQPGSDRHNLPLGVKLKVTGNMRFYDWKRQALIWDHRPNSPTSWTGPKMTLAPMNLLFEGTAFRRFQDLHVSRILHIVENNVGVRLPNLPTFVKQVEIKARRNKDLDFRYPYIAMVKGNTCVIKIAIERDLIGNRDFDKKFSGFVYLGCDEDSREDDMYYMPVEERIERLPLWFRRQLMNPPV